MAKGKSGSKKSKAKAKAKARPRAKAKARVKTKARARARFIKPKLTPAQLKASIAKNREKSIVISPQPAPKKAIARWGIIGGLFNPIHKGHLFIAQEAYQRYFLEKIIFVPCGQPPHRRSRGVAPVEDRVNMCRLAISPYPYFEVSRTEVDRPGPSYALDTLREFKYVPGREGSRDIFFVIGLDAFLEIKSWHKFKDCLNLARWIVFNRPGIDLGKLPKFLKKSPMKGYATRVYQVNASPPDISATEIRQLAKKRKDISPFVPASVAAYIKDNKLYRK